MPFWIEKAWNGKAQMNNYRNVIVHYAYLNDSYPTSRSRIVEYEIPRGNQPVLVPVDFYQNQFRSSVWDCAGKEILVGPYVLRGIEYLPNYGAIAADFNGVRVWYRIARHKLYWKTFKFWARVYRTLVIWNLATMHEAREGRAFQWTDINLIRWLSEIGKRNADQIHT